jgi:hypothetical protein
LAKEWTRAALAAAGAVLAGLAAASAQDEPAAFAGCAAPTCLAVELSPALRAALAAGEGVSVEAVADGLVLSYRGGAPIDVRLVAVRYDNGRLVRYGVSARTRLEAAGTELAVEGAADAVLHALSPATYRTAVVRPVEGAETAEVALPAYVGNVPPSVLVGEPGLVALEGAAEGSIGVIALEPEDPALRDGAAAESFGALVRVELVRP